MLNNFKKIKKQDRCFKNKEKFVKRLEQLNYSNFEALRKIITSEGKNIVNLKNEVNFLRMKNNAD